MAISGQCNTEILFYCNKKGKGRAGGKTALVKGVGGGGTLNTSEDKRVAPKFDISKSAAEPATAEARGKRSLQQAAKP